MFVRVMKCHASSAASHSVENKLKWSKLGLPCTDSSSKSSLLLVIRPAKAHYLITIKISFN